MRLDYMLKTYTFKVHKAPCGPYHNEKEINDVVFDPFVTFCNVLRRVLKINEKWHCENIQERR